jgi:endonuclease YncB( thermonuclease family)
MIPGKALCTLILLLYIALASGAPDEASGRVVLVTDGDTFDVEIDEHDGRIQEDTIRIRLADLDAPELYGERACKEGEWARDYTYSWLMDNIVTLDIDDVNGQDENGRWIAVSILKTAETSTRCWWIPEMRQ